MSEAFDHLVAIMDRLRDPGGCPWDRKQTLESLAGYVLEEAYEVVEAVHDGDPDELCGELGDLLLQIVFMARIGREHGGFDIDTVCRRIADKMVRRHPHVFADHEVADADEVVRNWESIKAEERGSDADRSTLDGVPASLPGLLKVYRMTEKAAAVGFDWRRPADVVAKIREEVDELEAEVGRLEAADSDRVRAEMGDVLFSLANLARHLGVEPETALQETGGRFQRRFRHMEALARDRGERLRDLDDEALDGLWQRAKAAESTDRQTG